MRSVFQSSNLYFLSALRHSTRRSTGFSEVIVVVGGCERVGGFNLPYTECYEPVTGEWKSLAKLPEFTKSEYAVCALRNDILVSGERVLQYIIIIICIITPIIISITHCIGQGRVGWYSEYMVNGKWMAFIYRFYPK